MLYHCIDHKTFESMSLIFQSYSLDQQAFWQVVLPNIFLVTCFFHTVVLMYSCTYNPKSLYLEYLISS